MNIESSFEVLLFISTASEGILHIFLFYSFWSYYTDLTTTANLLAKVSIFDVG